MGLPAVLASAGFDLKTLSVLNTISRILAIDDKIGIAIVELIHDEAPTRCSQPASYSPTNEPRKTSRI
jgi:hypothetical protein